MVTDSDVDELLAGANGDIDRDLLTEQGSGGLFSTGYFRTLPLVERLGPGEQPHFVFENKKRGIDIERRTRSEHVVPGSDYRAAIVLTDERILCVFGKQSGDRVVTISYDSIEDVEASRGIRRDKIVVDAGDVTYHLYTQSTARSGAGASFIRHMPEQARTQSSADAGTDSSQEHDSPSEGAASSSNTSATGSEDSSGGMRSESRNSDSTPTGVTIPASEDHKYSTESGLNEDDSSGTSSGISSVDRIRIGSEGRESAGPDETGTPESASEYSESSTSTDLDFAPWESDDDDPSAERVAASSSLPTAEDRSETTVDSTDVDDPTDAKPVTEPDDSDESRHETDVADVDETGSDGEVAEANEPAAADEPAGETNDDSGGDGESDESADAETAETGSISVPRSAATESRWLTETDPPLPTVDRVRSVGQDPVSFVTSAIERLSESGDDPDRETRIRVHSDLCNALDALPEDETDVGDEFESALRALETSLATDANELAHDGTRVSGHVGIEFVARDSDGEPIPDVAVDVAENIDEAAARTDAEGRVEVSVPTVVDPLDVTCQHPDYETVQDVVSMVRDQAVDVTLVATTSEPSDDENAVEREEQIADRDQARNDTGRETEPATVDDGGSTGTVGEATTESTPTREALLAELSRIDREWSQDVDRVLLHSVSDYHPDAFVDAFGNLEKAVATAENFNHWNTSDDTGGSKSDTTIDPMDASDSRESVDEKLDRAIDEAGIANSDPEADDQASTEPGYEEPSDRSDRQQQLLAELRRLDDEWKKDVDRRLLYSLGEYSPEEYEDEFGSLERANVAAGIVDAADTDLSPITQEREVPTKDRDPGSEGTTSDEWSPHEEDLLAELRQLDDEWKKDVDRRLLYSLGEYSPGEYEDAFGSLDEALVAAGVIDETEIDEQSSNRRRDAASDTDSSDTDSGSDPSSRTAKSNQGGYSKADVRAEIQRLTDELGEPPMVSHMQERGRMSPTPAYRHWGSWPEALAAAGVVDPAPDDAESDDDTESNAQTERGVTSQEHETDLHPNELAELYDLFRLFDSMIESANATLALEPGEYTNEWYDAVYDYWSGSGSGTASSLGKQQSARNDFSIDEYRKQYGDGTQITDFHHHTVATLPESVRVKLGQLDVDFDPSTARVPVAPDSGEALPVFVETERDLEDARSLLAEFPATPAADSAPDQDDGADTDVPPEGRLESIAVVVRSHDPNPGSRRTATLEVETPSGAVLDLDVWTKHGIDFDWNVGDRYELREVRHKVWNSNTGTGRSLSSTKDLVVRELRNGSTPTAGSDDESNSNDGRSGTSTGGSADGDEADGDEGGDVVDQIMEDVDI